MSAQLLFEIQSHLTERLPNCVEDICFFVVVFFSTASFSDGCDDVIERENNYSDLMDC